MSRLKDLPISKRLIFVLGLVTGSFLVNNFWPAESGSSSFSSSFLKVDSPSDEDLESVINIRSKHNSTTVIQQYYDAWTEKLLQMVREYNELLNQAGPSDEELSDGHSHRVDDQLQILSKLEEKAGYNITDTLPELLDNSRESVTARLVLLLYNQIRMMFLTLKLPAIDHGKNGHGVEQGSKIVSQFLSGDVMITMSNSTNPFVKVLELSLSNDPTLLQTALTLLDWGERVSFLSSTDEGPEPHFEKSRLISLKIGYLPAGLYLKNLSEPERGRLLRDLVYGKNKDIWSGKFEVPAQQDGDSESPLQNLNHKSVSTSSSDKSLQASNHTTISEPGSSLWDSICCMCNSCFFSCWNSLFGNCCFHSSKQEVESKTSVNHAAPGNEKSGGGSNKTDSSSSDANDDDSSRLAKNSFPIVSLINTGSGTLSDLKETVAQPGLIKPFSPLKVLLIGKIFVTIVELSKNHNELFFDLDLLFDLNRIRGGVIRGVDKNFLNPAVKVKLTSPNINLTVLDVVLCEKLPFRSSNLLLFGTSVLGGFDSSTGSSTYPFQTTPSYLREVVKMFSGPGPKVSVFVLERIIDQASSYYLEREYSNRSITFKNPHPNGRGLDIELNDSLLLNTTLLDPRRSIFFGTTSQESQSEEDLLNNMTTPGISEPSSTDDDDDDDGFESHVFDQQSIASLHAFLLKIPLLWKMITGLQVGGAVTILHEIDNLNSSTRGSWTKLNREEVSRNFIHFLWNARKAMGVPPKTFGEIGKEATRRVREGGNFRDFNNINWDSALELFPESIYDRYFCQTILIETLPQIETYEQKMAESESKSSIFKAFSERSENILLNWYPRYPNLNNYFDIASEGVLFQKKNGGRQMLLLSRTLALRDRIWAKYNKRWIRSVTLTSLLGGGESDLGSEIAPVSLTEAEVEMGELGVTSDKELGMELRTYRELRLLLRLVMEKKAVRVLAGGANFLPQEELGRISDVLELGLDIYLSSPNESGPNQESFGFTEHLCKLFSVVDESEKKPNLNSLLHISIARQNVNSVSNILDTAFAHLYVKEKVLNDTTSDSLSDLSDFDLSHESEDDESDSQHGTTVKNSLYMNHYDFPVLPVHTRESKTCGGLEPGPLEVDLEGLFSYIEEANSIHQLENIVELKKNQCLNFVGGFGDGTSGKNNKLKKFHVEKFLTLSRNRMIQSWEEYIDKLNSLSEKPSKYSGESESPRQRSGSEHFPSSTVTLGNNFTAEKSTQTDEPLEDCESAYRRKTIASDDYIDSELLNAFVKLSRSIAIHNLIFRIEVDLAIYNQHYNSLRSPNPIRSKSVFESFSWILFLSAVLSPFDLNDRRNENGDTTIIRRANIKFLEALIFNSGGNSNSKSHESSGLNDPQRTLLPSLESGADTSLVFFKEKIYKFNPDNKYGWESSDSEDKKKDSSEANLFPVLAMNLKKQSWSSLSDVFNRDIMGTEGSEIQNNNTMPPQRSSWPSAMSSNLKLITDTTETGPKSLSNVETKKPFWNSCKNTFQSLQENYIFAKGPYGLPQPQKKMKSKIMHAFFLNNILANRNILTEFVKIVKDNYAGRGSLSLLLSTRNVFNLPRTFQALVQLQQDSVNKRGADKKDNSQVVASIRLELSIFLNELMQGVNSLFLLPSHNPILFQKIFVIAEFLLISLLENDDIKIEESGDNTAAASLSLAWSNLLRLHRNYEYRQMIFRSRLSSSSNGEESDSEKISSIIVNGDVLLLYRLLNYYNYSKARLFLPLPKVMMLVFFLEKVFDFSIEASKPQTSFSDDSFDADGQKKTSIIALKLLPQLRRIYMIPESGGSRAKQESLLNYAVRKNYLKTIQVLCDFFPDGNFDKKFNSEEEEEEELNEFITTSTDENLMRQAWVTFRDKVTAKLGTPKSRPPTPKSRPPTPKSRPPTPKSRPPTPKSTSLSPAFGTVSSTEEQKSACAVFEGEPEKLDLRFDKPKKSKSKTMQSSSSSVATTVVAEPAAASAGDINIPLASHSKDFNRSPVPPPPTHLLDVFLSDFLLIIESLMRAGGIKKMKNVKVRHVGGQTHHIGGNTTGTGLTLVEVIRKQFVEVSGSGERERDSTPNKSTIQFQFWSRVLERLEILIEKLEEDQSGHSSSDDEA